jgi:DNA primase
MVMIKRFTDRIVLALDSDKAGIKATSRSVLSAYKHGCNVKVIVMPEGMDPADTIVKSKSQWDVCVADAQDYIDYRLELFNRSDHSFEERKSLVDNDLFTFVALTKSAMVQDRMLQKLSLFLGVSLDSVRNDFKQFTPEHDMSFEKIKKPTEIMTENITTQQEILYLFLYLQEKEITVDADIDTEQTELYHDIFGTSLLQDSKKIPEETKNLQLFILEEQNKDTTQSILKISLFRILIQEKIRLIDKELLITLEKLRQSESEKNTEKIKEYMNKQQKLLHLKTDLTNKI